MSFIQRLINVTFTGGQGSQIQGQTITLTGLRVSARITHVGSVDMGEGEFHIWGMSLSHINQLSTLGIRIIDWGRDNIMVQAGDAVNGMATVWSGNVIGAYGEFTGAPQVPFIVQSRLLPTDATINTAPTSYSGTTDTATVMGQLAGKLGLTLENNNVNTKLASPYFSGSTVDQMQACAKQANCSFAVDGDGQTLAIYPKNQGRTNSNMVTIAPPPTGNMIGYPTFHAQGIRVKNLFDPSIGLGKMVSVQSSLRVPSGTWVTYRLEHILESTMPRGKWESTIDLYNSQFMSTPPVV